MSRLMAWGAILALLVVFLGSGAAVPQDGVALGAKADKPAATPAATPTAPPDLVASYRKVCEAMPATEREQCLLGIVEQLGLLMDEKAQLDICQALTDPLNQAVCTALAMLDPSQCNGLQGDTAVLDRELCIGSVAETMCFRLPKGPEHDQCLMGIATRHDASLACASIGEHDVRWLCQAVALKDATLCARIADPVSAKACRDRVSSAQAGAATASPSAAPSAGAWYGTLAGADGSPLDGSWLRLTLGASGQLTGSGHAPKLPGTADGPVSLTVISSTARTDSWSGEMKIERQDDGTIEMDALAGLASSDTVGWTARRDGDRLTGTVGSAGFDIGPAD